MLYKKILILVLVMLTVIFIFQDAVGIILNPPELSITDIQSRILKHISEGHKVLLVYMDGLGYINYEKLLKNGIIPNIAGCGTAEKALTVYPPITDVAFASMATGTTPAKHGIRKRGDGDLRAETVFDVLKAKGKSCILVEGDIKILKDDVETVLNIDENDNGTLDDEVYEAAVKAADKKPDLLMVHFHSFDDAGHKYGPYSNEARVRAEVLDGYVGKLREQWKDVIIIAADHGMHDEGEGGSHGDFIPEDMYIPVIDTAVYKEGGK